MQFMAGSLFYLVSFLKKELKGTGTMWKRYAEIFSGAAVFFFYATSKKTTYVITLCHRYDSVPANWMGFWSVC